MMKQLILLLITATFLHFPVLNLHAAAINLPRSGQTTSYASGDDAAVMAGQVSPSPRYTAANGTVSDHLTGLVWLQNANCKETINGVAKGSGHLSWANSLIWSSSLATGKCGLADGSVAGQWRLPTRKELQTILDHAQYNPAVPAGHPFSDVQTNGYWSSTTYADSTISAWFVNLVDGSLDYTEKTGSLFVWPVRDGE